MRERAQALSHRRRGGGRRARAESLGKALAQRVAELTDDPAVPLFFGKLSNTGGDAHHIGRRHVTDHTGEPMVLDCRRAGVGVTCR